MFVSKKGWMQKKRGRRTTATVMTVRNDDNDGDDGDNDEEASTHLSDPQYYRVDEPQKIHLG